MTATSMAWAQTTIRLPPKSRGCHLVTNDIVKQIPDLRLFNIGMANIFLQHTSASLTLNENADPDVRVDMEMALNKLAPECDEYIHADEGPDDMPGHIKSSIFGASLNIPITNGRLNLGTWQGINISPRVSYSSAASQEPVQQLQVDHLVIGAGVVGLAVAERLATRGKGSVLLVEKNSSPGQETSSRNSEVIHAGIYYPVDSLKTKLCIRGNELMYDFCDKYNVQHRRTTKWVVGHSNDDLEYLENLHQKAQGLLLPTKRMPGPSTYLITEKQMKEQEPHVRGKLALVSERTGIVDVHGFMNVLEARIEDHGGDIILQCKVTNIEKLFQGAAGSQTSGSGYRVEMMTPAGPAVVEAQSVINCAGLHADKVYNLLNLTGLGTHLTLDLAGHMRFGPDVLYVERLDDYSIDPSTVGSPDSLKLVSEVVSRYLPEINPAALYADYAGIRPKLAGPGEPFRDFIVHQHDGFVNLVGIESPGLTSSLAIAEEVENMLF
ncbi:hypothetical protein BGZ76_010830 [Entomortierella beljakovae]|nr:hypothetical protein BGZ76_010830 [Entomortierella beljakovae]